MINDFCIKQQKLTDWLNGIAEISETEKLHYETQVYGDIFKLTDQQRPFILTAVKINAVLRQGKLYIWKYILLISLPKC